MAENSSTAAWARAVPVAVAAQGPGAQSLGIQRSLALGHIFNF